jgi:hypothetical protein
MYIYIYIYKYTYIHEYLYIRMYLYIFMQKLPWYPGGNLRLVSLSSGQVLQEYHGSHKHESFKIESTIASDDCHVISCSEDGDIVVYDLVQGNVIFFLVMNIFF